MYQRADNEILKIAKREFENGTIRQVLEDHLQCEKSHEVADYIIELIVRTTRW
jgi:hypothetical protein